MVIGAWLMSQYEVHDTSFEVHDARLPRRGEPIRAAAWVARALMWQAARRILRRPR